MTLSSTRKANLVATPLLTLLLLTIGCAVPGEPMPPLLEIPAPVSTLTAQQVGSEIVIRFPVPQLTTEGTLPRRMERIELLLAFASPAAPQPELAALAPVRVWIPSDFADGAGELYHEAPLDGSRIGQRAWLAVRASNQRGVDGGLSNVVAVDIVNLPEAPGALTARVSEAAIEILWTGSARSAFAASASPPPPTENAVAYEIFRATGDSSEWLERIGESSTTSFADTTFNFGQTYRYAVRAIVASEISVAATPLADSIEVAALDRFAPAVPGNLRAIAVTGAVELAWSPNSEADLAGYNIYREQLADDGRAAPRVKLNSALLDIPLFRDEHPQPGSRYRYAATAADRDGNESPPSNEETVETE